MYQHILTEEWKMMKSYGSKNNTITATYSVKIIFPTCILFVQSEARRKLFPRTQASECECVLDFSTIKHLIFLPSEFFSYRKEPRICEVPAYGWMICFICSQLFSIKSPNSRCVECRNRESLFFYIIQQVLMEISMHLGYLTLRIQSLNYILKIFHTIKYIQCGEN